MQSVRKGIGRAYRNLKLLATATGIGGAIALGAYFHPLPIERNWGDIAARDMAAKSEIAYDIQNNMIKYGTDGNWDSGELLYLTASTTPRRFLKHRIQEMRPPLLGTYFDSLLPKHALEDHLYLTYNQLFSDGTRSLPRGELASFHDARQALFHGLYNMFVNKDRVTYEEWLSGKGLGPKAFFETDKEWALRQISGSIDLSQSQLDEQLASELDKLTNYFSSEETQNHIKQEADYLGNRRDRLWNGVLFGLGSLFVFITPKIVKRKTTVES